MNQVHSSSSDQVTVLVFKDHLAARTFHVPREWISRLGFLTGFLLLFSIVMSVTAVRYYRLANRAETADTRVLTLNPASAPAVVPQKVQDPGVETPSAVTDILETQAPTPKSPEEANLHPEDQTHTITANLFSALTAPSPQTTLPNPSTLAFTIQNPRYSWQKSTLQVRFALQYVKNDRGSQQGKIIVLARGPSLLLSFPAETLNPAGLPSLINYTKGEFFSVSRYREGTATFGPLTSKDLIKEVEILILSKSGELLLHQSFPLKDKLVEVPAHDPSPQEDS